MTYPHKFWNGSMAREAEPGETIDVWLSGEEGQFAVEDKDGTPLIVTVNSENAARLIANQTAFSCGMLPGFPWALLHPLPPTTSLGAPRQRFQFAA